MNRHLAEWFVALQRITPQHGLSRLGAKLAESRRPAIKNALIRQFIRTYGVDLEEAASAEPADYACFNDFFTRALKDDARPIDPATSAIVSPADGTISQLGRISGGNIFQAKGKSFSTAALLGAADRDSEQFQRGHFITTYLSPSDYHRVHMPVAGTLDYCRYIPGKLFSVNNATTDLVDGLFARNARVVCLFDSPVGRCAVILVGAMMVAGIESVWGGHYRTGEMRLDRFEPGEVTLEKGDEMGRFKFGSTVILLFEPGAVRWSEDLADGQSVRMGKTIGEKLPAA